MTRQTSIRLPPRSDRGAQLRRRIGRERRKAVSSWMACVLFVWNVRGVRVAVKAAGLSIPGERLVLMTN
jgi:hypothetical protein